MVGPTGDEAEAAAHGAPFFLWNPCLDVRNGLWRRSSLSNDRLRMTCEFEAPDAESVREAFRTAGLPYERVWTASVYAIEDYPEMMERLKALEERQKR